MADSTTGIDVRTINVINEVVVQDKYLRFDAFDVDTYIGSSRVLSWVVKDDGVHEQYVRGMDISFVPWSS
ncbi:hypothetical protein LINPERHAP1_LOCUS31653 [Linum perenne]